MTLKLEFFEHMVGNCTLHSAPNQERAFDASLQIRIVDLQKFRKDRLAEAQGEIHIAGFADHAATRGSVEITPFLGKRIHYALWFKNNEGERCCFEGQKNINTMHFLHTITHFEAQIFNSAHESIGSARVRFDLRKELIPWLSSMRVFV